MMRILLVVMIVTVFPAAVSANPPARPAPLTPAQFDHILKLEVQPEHAAVLEVHATYKSEREKQMELVRASDDIWTAVFYSSYPVLLTILLVAAAPL